MEKKNGLTLTDVLNQFRSGLNKEAEEVEDITEEERNLADLMAARQTAAEEIPEEELPEEELLEEEELEEDVVEEDLPEEEVPVEEDEEIEEAAESLVEAKNQKELAVEALKQIAANAAAGEEELIAKEASVFGRLFADSFLDQVKEASLQEQITQEAYQFTKQAFETRESSEILSKIAEEAYSLTKQSFEEDFLNKVAEEAYEIANKNLNKEDIDSEILNKIAEEAYSVVQENFQYTNEDISLDKIAEEAYSFVMETMAGLE